jgi:sensor histidine kinase YesM
MAQHPLTGFCLTAMVSGIRDSLTWLWAPEALSGVSVFAQLGIASMLQGLGTALILTVVALIRDRDEQTEAAASAEVRALQSRMKPHFLFNTLNALAALAIVAPREVPGVVGSLRQLLGAMFDQTDRALIPLQEELAVVHAYLEIESLRLGPRLKVEADIDPGLANLLTPPFSLQPLVENAIQHGMQSSRQAGCLRLIVRRVGDWLEMSVSDDGHGVPSSKVEEFFFPVRPGMHALVLLRRRLQALFDDSFRLEIRSGIGQGTTVTMRTPIRSRGEVSGVRVHLPRQRLRPR